ncbi:MAG: ABC transporter ATP-binding protein [Muribaculaceae bacterium]|nr:ABC transporter ATP-binding protein [Muribaculaceae bacterium]
MISARNISKSFGDVTVLNNIDVDIYPGKITAIVGPSGAGKTTLLQILGTLMTPDSGTLRYDDNDVLTLNDRRLSHFRNSSIGFVFQFHRLLPEFTLQENVALPALIGGSSRSDAMERARELLVYMGLEHRLNHKPSTLSGGECQRGAVARALVNRPKVVLADEPTGSLDTANRTELQQLFRNLCRDLEATFVIVTHDSTLADQADRVIKMADGRIIQ